MTGRNESSRAASTGFGSGAGITMTGPLGVSLAAVVIGIIVGTWGFVSIVSAMFGSGTGDVDPDKEIQRLMALHQEDLKVWQDRFNGRSVFFKPPAPPRPAPVQSVRNDPPPDPPPPPPPPGPDPIYKGPSIAFAYADVVYFAPMSASDSAKYLRIAVGEEQSGLAVMSVSLPWTVKVGYKGGEYDVPIFSRTEDDAFLLTTPRPVILTNFLVAAPTPQEPMAANTAPSTAAPEPIAVSAQPADGSPPPMQGRPSRTSRRGSEDGPRATPAQPDPEAEGVREETGEEVADPEQPPADEEVPIDEEPLPSLEEEPQPSASSAGMTGW